MRLLHFKHTPTIPRRARSSSSGCATKPFGWCRFILRASARADALFCSIAAAPPADQEGGVPGWRPGRDLGMFWRGWHGRDELASSRYWPFELVSCFTGPFCSSAVRARFGSSSRARICLSARPAGQLYVSATAVCPHGVSAFDAVAGGQCAAHARARTTEGGMQNTERVGAVNRAERARSMGKVEERTQNGRGGP